MAKSNVPVVELKHVDMTFTKHGGIGKKPTLIHALTDVSLTIGQGEVLALVGESGGGKSTIGNVISGIYQPTGGQLLFDGVDVSRMTRQQHVEYRRQVQIVQQDAYAALNPVHTVFHSLSAPLLQKRIVRGRKAALAKVTELLEMVELRPVDQFIDKYPHQLSGGQRQRILLARAISLEPRLIIADEPVSMIDVSLRVSALNLMHRLNEQTGISFLYITHDLATARYIGRAGRVAVLYMGQIVEEGPVNAVTTSPKHPYLQTLISVVPIPDPWVARNRKRIELKSLDMPSPIAPPSGCRFHTRCPYAQPICQQQRPEMREYEGRNVACHLVEQLPQWSLDDYRRSDEIIGEENGGK